MVKKDGQTSEKRVVESSSANDRTRINDTSSRRRVLYLLGVGGVGGLAGCAGNPGQGTEPGTVTGTDRNESSPDSDDDTSSSKTFVVGLSSEISTLDLHSKIRRPGGTVLSAVHETLFRINEELEPEPHLAKEYTRNSDATEFVFQLREDVTFHNGEKFNAETAKWNFDHLLNDSPWTEKLGPISSIEATGDYELTFQYDERYPLLERFLTDDTTGFISKQAYEEAGDSYGQSTAVGTGPYQFDAWERGTAVTVSRFEEYNWGPEFAENQGPGRVQKFRFEFIPESTTLVKELTNGRVHGSAYVTLSDIGSVEKSPNTKLLRKKYTRPGYLAINTQKKPTDNVQVRQAITHAVQKEPVIKVAVAGEGYPIWNIVPPLAVNAISADRAKNLGQPYDPQRARSLLDEAGWTNSAEGKTRTKDGKELNLTFYAFTIPRYKKIGTVVGPMLSEVGIKTDFQALEPGTLYKNLESGNHHITTMAFGGNWAVKALEPILVSTNSVLKGGTNYSAWRNSEFDGLVEKAKAAQSDAARRDAIIKAQELVLEKAPVTPIMAFNKIYGYKNEVTGIDAWTEHPWWPDAEWLHRLEVGL